ncbi:LysM peptidoglycan-binding domain-containing protein [Bacteroides sp. 214]|uniref:glucosaminidase domain-containing protein n=1 Tax=Bacteroides sp. 214 TaxID=2302935 RepID=UPI0013CF9291|nr:glucosaminidase domain-containing protein [Bacteroides sp. 214]NDW12411.1 LysM peptidoglycan-binding domain-containing protein [Bacteroides sp. 214]
MQIRIHYRRLFLFLLIFPLSLSVHAQGRNKQYLEYINTYKGIAVEEMIKYKIPASITLAQGLLESGAGRSKLATRSNNHFGIKCGSSWRGKTVRHDDDARNECFRAYKNSKESYEDHSKFLANGARYAFLFKLPITDYKGWARGLKKAGYATDPSYASRLITIIEDYELYKYDRVGKKSKDNKSGRSNSTATSAIVNPHQVFLSNDLAYIVARNGDTFESLGKEFSISWRKLVKYNDLHKEYTLADGDIIYLKEKKSKANKKHTVHIVKDGDSMHSISQMYGMKMKQLYKMNKKDADYVPEVGQRLRLR